MGHIQPLACFWKLSFIETQPCPRVYLLCLWMLACYNGRAGEFWQRPCSLPRLNYLLSGPLKKKCDDSCKAAAAFQIPKACCPLLTEWVFPSPTPLPLWVRMLPQGNQQTRTPREKGSNLPGKNSDVCLFLGSMLVFFITLLKFFMTWGLRKLFVNLSPFSYSMSKWNFHITWKCHICFQLIEQKANNMYVAN